MAFRIPFRSYLAAIAQGVGVFATVYTVSDVFVGLIWVEGGSMRPTINPNKFAPRSRTLVLVDRFRYRPRRGDIITAWSPDEFGKSIVKRVVALEGDYVVHRKTNRIIRIPNGAVWVEGDNADNSHDSNDYGPLPMNLIHGKATRVLVPQELDRGFEFLSQVFSPLPWKDTSSRLSSHDAYLEQQIADAKRESLIEDLIRKHELEERRFREAVETDKGDPGFESQLDFEKSEAAKRVEKLLDDLRVSSDAKSGIISQLKSELVRPPSIIKSKDSRDY